MQKVLKSNAAQWAVAAVAAYITILGTLYYNDWVYWTFSSGSVALLCWLGLCWVYRQAFSRLNARLWWISLAGGVVLSAFLAVGDRLFSQYDAKWMPIRIAGYLPLFFAAFALLFSFAEKRAELPAGKNPPPILESVLANSRKSLSIVAGLLLLCWLPYCVINWPGLVSPDVKLQIQMWLGKETFTSHHPVVHTAFLGLSVQLGQLLGSEGVGVGIGMLLQTAAMALVVSSALRQMARLGVSLAWRVGVLLFYGLFPIFGWYATTLWKDIWLAAFTLLFYLVLVEVCRTKRDFFRSRGNVVRLAVSALGLILSKNNGVYIFLIALAVLLLTQKGCRKQLLAGLLAGAALWVMVEGPLYSVLGVEKGDMREALSIPMLQIAKVVATDPGAISEQDKALIGTVMPYDQLAELYDPVISDNIKILFDSEPISRQPLKYLGLWVRMGLNSPGIYLYSFLEQTSGYWYPEVRYWIFSEEAYETLVVDDTDSFVVAAKDSWRDSARMGWEGVLRQLRVMPGIGMLFSIGFVFWLLIAAALYALYTRRWMLFPPMALFLGVWLTCMASPVYAEYRYAYPAILCVPTVLALTFGTKRPAPAKEVS